MNFILYDNFKASINNTDRSFKDIIYKLFYRVTKTSKINKYITFTNICLKRYSFLNWII